MSIYQQEAIFTTCIAEFRVVRVVGGVVAYTPYWAEIKRTGFMTWENLYSAVIKSAASFLIQFVGQGLGQTARVDNIFGRVSIGPLAGVWDAADVSQDAGLPVAATIPANLAVVIEEHYRWDSGSQIIRKFIAGWQSDQIENGRITSSGRATGFTMIHREDVPPFVQGSFEVRFGKVCRDGVFRQPTRAWVTPRIAPMVRRKAAVDNMF